MRSTQAVGATPVVRSKQTVGLTQAVGSTRTVGSKQQEQGYTVNSQYYPVGEARVRNLEVELPGTERPDEIVIVGAHYDTWNGNPGANDNASGVAAILELSRSFAGKPAARTLRFVAFVNEEPPYFQSETMGSLVYAKRSAARGENIVGMVALDEIGYYSSAPKSQHYPKIVAPLYPKRGNFVALVSNTRSRRFVKQVVRSFESHTDFPEEHISAPDTITGIGWSDHWSFYRQGYPSIMISDTAPFRYAHYHREGDTPDKLTYEPMTRVVDALHGVVGDLVR